MTEAIATICYADGHCEPVTVTHARAKGYLCNVRDILGKANIKLDPDEYVRNANGTPIEVHRVIPPEVGDQTLTIFRRKSHGELPMLFRTGDVPGIIVSYVSDELFDEEKRVQIASMRAQSRAETLKKIDEMERRQALARHRLLRRGGILLD